MYVGHFHGDRAGWAGRIPAGRDIEPAWAALAELAADAPARSDPPRRRRPAAGRRARRDGARARALPRGRGPTGRGGARAVPRPAEADGKGVIGAVAAAPF